MPAASTPTNSNVSDQDETDTELPVEESSSTRQLIANLTSTLSQVKNKRVCQYSAYDYLRYLSVLRFFEKTEKTNNDPRIHKEVAREVAELLWVVKTNSSHNAHTTLQHKAKSIQQWANEYRATGQLSEHVHGTHTKTQSLLAQKKISREARRVLAKMSSPGPVKLKKILDSDVFPKFGRAGETISENTCRDYMKRWGWLRSGQRSWVANSKKVLQVSESESDEGIGGSDETDILETSKAAPQQAPAVNVSDWSKHTLPSPTSALRPVPPTSTTDMSTNSGHIFNFQNHHPVTTPTSLGPFNNATSTTEDRNTAYFFTPQYDLNQTPTFPYPVQPPYFDASHFQQQYVPQQNRYVPKSLDGLVPDPPGMMGMRPAPHGVPVPTFAAPPSMMNVFTHDSSFPSHTTRRNTVNIPPNSDYSHLSHQHYTTDMN